MPYNHSSIVISLKQKLKYNRSICISSYVHPNIVIKTLQQHCETRLYIDAQFSIGKNWQDLASLTNFYQNNVMEKNASTNNCLI